MALPHYGFGDTLTQSIFEDIFDMLSEICNYNRGRTIEGIYTKRKLTNTGGKYKWTDGQEIHFICEKDNIDFTCGVTNYYEDSNSYNQGDCLVHSSYSFNPNRDIVMQSLDTAQGKFTYLKAKLRIIRIHKILNTN